MGPGSDPTMFGGAADVSRNFSYHHSGAFRTGRITEITLHGYRYAWARRAKSFGMPLREAMAHLGHGSKAVHQAYSESAEIVTLPLEFYEKQHRDKILQFTANQESSPVTVAGGRP
jgi:hypothetical protein